MAHLAGPIALTVTPNLKVQVDRGKPTPEEERLLETWGRREADYVCPVFYSFKVSPIDNQQLTKAQRAFGTTFPSSYTLVNPAFGWWAGVPHRRL